MKTKILFCAITLLCLFQIGKASAQDTGLLFNRVILLEIAANTTMPVNIDPNMIWKIESVSMGSSGSAPSVFLRNDALKNIGFFSTAVSGSSARYPYWLPTGFKGSFFNNNTSYFCTVSILEYKKQ